MLVKDEESNEFIAFVKGADSEIRKILKDPNSDPVNSEFENIDFFARKGLRTLAFAQKILSEQDAEKARNMEEKDAD